MQTNTKVAALCRVRNSENILYTTLMHLSQYKFIEAFYFFDDASTDGTLHVINRFHKETGLVKYVTRNNKWESDPVERNEAEGKYRDHLYKKAVADGYEWIYYFDADEMIYFEHVDFTADAYKFRLFDFYITPEDVGDEWYARRFMGCEYREIVMLFKANDQIKFHQREPSGLSENVKLGGSVKHFGKSISVDDWERKCLYYMQNRGGSFIPKFTNKWRGRIGKAIHTKSDFNRPLIRWSERHEKGILLIDK